MKLDIYLGGDLYFGADSAILDEKHLRDALWKALTALPSSDYNGGIEIVVGLGSAHLHLAGTLVPGGPVKPKRGPHA